MFDSHNNQLEEIMKALGVINNNIISLSKNIKTDSNENHRNLTTQTNLSDSDKEFLDQRFSYLSKQMSNSVGDNELVENLSGELSKYKEDFYLKNQKGGLDGMIYILDKVCTMIEAEQDEKVINILKMISTIVEKTMERTFHVTCHHSEIGTPFNYTTMKAYSGDSIDTSNESLEDTVARSIFPSIHWHLPRINENNSSQDFLYKEEMVKLYQYKINN